MEYTASAVTFWIDDVRVAQFTAADVTGATWETEAKMQTFCSVEKHGAWAGQTYADGTASMRDHALLA